VVLDRLEFKQKNVKHRLQDMCFSPVVFKQWKHAAFVLKNMHFKFQNNSERFLKQLKQNKYLIKPLPSFQKLWRAQLSDIRPESKTHLFGSLTILECDHIL
jgi:hypothetical protein